MAFYLVTGPVPPLLTILVYILFGLTVTLCAVLPFMPRMIRALAAAIVGAVVLYVVPTLPTAVAWCCFGGWWLWP